ncbi:MAG: SPOR domain-containing protein [Phycisphaerales bacterium]
MNSYGRARHSPRRLIFVALLGGLALVSPSGCAGGGRAAGGSRAAASGSYVEEYQRGNFAVAKSLALSAYSGSTGVRREQAGLIVGLSAQALDKYAEAKQYLRPCLASQDPEISGRAGAALGLIARDEGDKYSASTLLRDAATKLKGDEAAKAAMFAGDAYTSLGKTSEAATQYALAAKSATSAALKTQIQERQLGKKFAVQAGAFSTRANAEKRVKEVAPKSIACGYGQPRVVASSSGGKSVYLVYIGEFGLRQDATEAMMKMKVPEGRVAEAN